MNFNEFYLFESEEIDVEFIKKSIQDAVKEDPKRLGHGNTGKTGFWILSTGKVVPYRSGWKEAVKDKNAIAVHSHSSASANQNTKDPFQTFSGEDLKLIPYMQKYDVGDTIVVISSDGYMDILKGGNWQNKDYRYDADNDEEEKSKSYEKTKDSTQYDRDLLKDLAKERGATYLTKLKWK